MQHSTHGSQGKKGLGAPGTLAAPARTSQLFNPSPECYFISFCFLLWTLQLLLCPKLIWSVWVGETEGAAVSEVTVTSCLGMFQRLPKISTSLFLRD